MDATDVDPAAIQTVKNNLTITDGQWQSITGDIYNNVSIGTTNTLILSDNPQRLSLVVVNNGSNTVYIGPDTSVTTANGIKIVASGTYSEDSGGTKMYCGPFYGIASDGTTIVAYWERTR